MIPPVVDAAFLSDHPEAVLADVRWYLDGRDGFAAFRDGHLPGARWVDLETKLCAAGLPATEGRHPLPTPQAFAASMSELGIGDDTVVVAYDDSGGITAGRLVVMLRMLGHDAAVLDGGLHGWEGPIESGPGMPPTPATFTDKPWPADRLASADTTGEAALAGVPVIDARSFDRFTGEATMVDKTPGHIPGARSAPATDVLGPDGRFTSPAQLRTHYARRGIDDTTDDAIAYCGSGVSACINILGMEHAGLGPPRLFVGSWSAWSADPARDAALGE
ncbi:MAG: putative thiosulfate sulfurtransferase [Ilumatobacteraceae bacterium]|nr:putative thiosulfate sulfurtransferase [Ilumatobacteraceae bacterium]